MSLDISPTHNPIREHEYARQELRSFAYFCTETDAATLAEVVDGEAIAATLARIKLIEVWFGRYTAALRQRVPQ